MSDQPSPFQPPPADGPCRRPLVIGHRGAAGAAPENTIPAIRHAVRVGADAVEFDLQATADGHLVLLHDATLDRTTDGTGAVAETSLAELLRRDAGYRFRPGGAGDPPFRGRGVRIPRLEEAMEAAEDLPVVVESKSPEAGRLLASWLERHPEEAARMIVGGFDHEEIREAASRSAWRCATAVEVRRYVLLAKLGLSRYGRPRAEALMVPERRGLLRLVTRSLLRDAHRNGLGVHVWTVNRIESMRRLLSLGVDGLITDLPGRARRIVDGWCSSGHHGHRDDDPRGECPREEEPHIGGSGGSGGPRGRSETGRRP